MSLTNEMKAHAVALFQEYAQGKIDEAEHEAAVLRKENDEHWQELITRDFPEELRDLVDYDPSVHPFSSGWYVNVAAVNGVSVLYRPERRSPSSFWCEKITGIDFSRSEKKFVPKTEGVTGFTDIMLAIGEALTIQGHNLGMINQIAELNESEYEIREAMARTDPSNVHPNRMTAGQRFINGVSEDNDRDFKIGLLQALDRIADALEATAGY